MKHFTSLVLSLAATLIFAGAAVAQDDYAPLVQKETISVSRINFDQLNSDQISQKIVKIANSAVDYFVSDKNQATEIKKTVPIASIFIAQAFANYVQPLQDAGVKYAYIVVEQPEDPEETLYPYVAIPVKGLSKEQKDGIREALKTINKNIPEETREQASLKYRFERHDFLFVLLAPADEDADDVKAYMKKHFTKLDTVEKPEFAEGFKAIDPTALFCSVGITVQNDALTDKQIEEALDKLEDNGADEELADTLKNVAEKFAKIGKELASYTKSATFYISAEKEEIVYTIHTNSADDAKKFADTLENTLVKEFVATMNDTINKATEDSDLDDDDKALLAEGQKQFQKLVEVFKKMKVDGANATWKMDAKFWSDNKPVFDEIGAFIKEKVMPKVNMDVDVDGLDDVDDDDEGDLDK